MRARLALVASGQPCALREVVLRDKPAALLEASPKGTVPVLVTPEGVVIEQSLEIMLWALRRHDPLGWLAPTEGTVDDILALVAECDGEFKPHLDRYKYPGRFAAVDIEPSARDRASSFVSALEQRLGQRRHLVGDRMSMADAALVPFVRQFAMVDADWFSSQPWPRLREWLSEAVGSPLFALAMVRHAAWAQGQDEVVFPSEGVPTG